jgi:hypothetical protein
MPTYIVTSPDGKEYEITAPEGATQEQVLAYAQANFPKQRTAGESAARGAGLAARAGISGVAALPAMLADAPVAVGNIVSSLFGGKTMQLPSQALQRTLTAAGLPEPETTTEKALMAGAEAATGTAGLAKAAAQTGSRLLAPLAKDVPAQVAGAGAAGAAAVPVAEVVTEKTESPLAGTIAALAVGIPAGTAGSRAVRGVASRETLPTLEEIKDRAQGHYKTMSDQGINIKPQSALNFVAKTEQELAKLNLNPKLDTHKPVATVLEDWKDMIGQKRVSFDKLEQMRSKMNELRSSKEPATRRLASAAISEMDSYMASLTGKDLITGQGNLDKAVAAVSAARKDWRNLSRATVLEDALDIAEAKALDPKASEGELIRRQLISLSANKEKIRLFSEREQNAIRATAKGGSADPLLTILSRFNPERSQLAGAGALAATASNPLLGLGLAGTGFAADKTLSATRRRELERLVQQVGSGKVPPEALSTLYARMFGASQGASE